MQKHPVIQKYGHLSIKDIIRPRIKEMVNLELEIARAVGDGDNVSLCRLAEMCLIEGFVASTEHFLMVVTELRDYSDRVANPHLTLSEQAGASDLYTEP